LEKKKASLFYVLSDRAVVFLTIYYATAMLVSIAALVWVMAVSTDIKPERIPLFAGLSSIAVASMLCCVQYLRRLYKACIEQRVSKPESDLRHFGNLVYFLFRPLIAIVFALLADFAMLAGVIIVTSVDLELNSRFLYLCIVVSGMIGFSIGRVLDVFESVSEKRIKSIAAEAGGEENNG